MELQERSSGEGGSSRSAGKPVNSVEGGSSRSAGKPINAKISFDEGGTVRRNATATLNQISADMQLSSALR